MPSDKMTKSQQLMNGVVTVSTGWILFNLLLIPYSGYLLPLASKDYIPVCIIDLYNALMFFVVGIVVGILSKAKTKLIVLLTFFSIFTTSAIIGNDKNISPYINFSTLISLASMAIGGFIGHKIKGFRVKHS